MDSFHPTLPVPPKNGVVVFPLGGCDQVGLNATLYGQQGPRGPEWILVDCGNGIGEEAPKRTGGLEKQYPNFSVLQQLGKSLRACVITHAHEDHIGAVNAYWPALKCRIYAPRFAYAVLDGRFRRTNTRHQVTMLPYEPGRPLQIGRFAIDTIPVTHSTPDCVALAIRTGSGTIVHSGDWKLDDFAGVGRGTDQRLLKQIGDQGVRLLVNESTNASKAGMAGSERDALDGIEDIIKNAKGPVILSGFASNLARVVAARDIAHRNGRSVGVIGGSLDKNIAAGFAARHLTNPDDYMDIVSLSHLPASKQLLFATGAQGEPLAGLNRIIAGETPFNINGQTEVILSSSRIPGNEASIDAMTTSLRQMGAKIWTRDNAPVHVSGHGNIEDHKRLYELLRPATLLPVHGGPEQRDAQAALAAECGIPQVLNTPGDGVPILVTRDRVQELPRVAMQIWGGDDYNALPKEDAAAFLQHKAEQEAARPKRPKRPFTVRPRVYTPVVPTGRNAEHMARDPERNRPRGPEKHTMVYHPAIIEQLIHEQKMREQARERDGHGHGRGPHRHGQDQRPQTGQGQGPRRPHPRQASAGPMVEQRNPRAQHTRTDIQPASPVMASTAPRQHHPARHRGTAPQGQAPRSTPPTQPQAPRKLPSAFRHPGDKSRQQPER